MKVSILLWICLLLGYCVKGQVTTEPEFPTAEDSIRIIYDATLGTSGLVGAAKVYMHSGVILDSPTGTFWQNVVGNWGQDDGIGLMTKISGESDKWEITIFPRGYFGVAQGIVIYRIGMVFRNADGSKEGKTDANGDIFLELSQGGLTVNLSNPVDRSLAVDQNDTITIEAASSEIADFTLTIGGLDVDNQSNIISYSYIHTVTDTTGSVDVILSTTNGIDTVTKEFNYFIRSATVSSPRPAGIIDGINYIDGDNSRVFLSLLAPTNSTAYVVGEFTDWKITPDYQMARDGPHFWIEIQGLSAGVEYAFQYWVDENVYIADPFGDKILDPDDRFIPGNIYPGLKSYPSSALHPQWYFNRASVIETGQTAYQWKNTNFVKPDKENLVIYEMLIRDFFADDQESYNNLIDTLSYLTDLGVNAIELMPITEFNGNSSWGYNNTFMFAPDKAYGTKNKLKEFIDTAHGKGTAVIMDMVMNHHDVPAPYVLLDFDFANFKAGFSNPWFNRDAPHKVLSFFFDLNHSSQYTQQYLDSVNHYWLNEYKFDGLRFDLSKGFTQKSTIGYNDWAAVDPGRISILKRMADKIWEHTPDAYIILEHFADNTEEKELADYGMMLWGNSHHNYKQIALGYIENSNIDWIYHGTRGWNNKHVVGYMESHDEQRLMFENLNYGNSLGDYSVMDKFVGLKRMEAAFAFLLSVPGPKMMWQFGELGYDIDINAYGGRVNPKPPPWNNVEDLDYNHDLSRIELKQVVKELIRLKTTYPAFATNDVSITNTESLLKQLILRHEPLNENPTSPDQMSVVILGNFDLQKKTVSANFPHTGTWYNYFEGTSTGITVSPANIELYPGEFALYTNYELDKPNIVTKLKHDVFEQNSVKIYPNPFSDLFKIESPLPELKYKLSLIDLSGILQYQGEYHPGDSLDLSYLSPGFYLLIAEDTKGNAVYAKVIKE